MRQPFVRAARSLASSLRGEGAQRTPIEVFADQLAAGRQKGFKLGAFGQNDTPVYLIYLEGDLAG